MDAERASGREHLRPVSVPEPAPRPEATVDPTEDEEARVAVSEARVLIDRWKKQSSAKNPFSARSLWRRNRRFDIDKEQAG